MYKSMTRKALFQSTKYIKKNSPSVLNLNTQETHFEMSQNEYGAVKRVQLILSLVEEEKG